ncbi:glucuronosyltransferase PGSIP8 [Pelomyxa schiedti]|nr:glucuronosyltransferase PGSIP8 [Pelomyxa schiedti]
MLMCGQTNQGRFHGTLNKLHAWNMTEYARVVLLDADVIILQNSDELMNCGAFCAAFINPCIFHTGVLVLTPNGAVFDDMINKLRDLPSYDGGDQGFFNSYFPEVLGAQLFLGKMKNPESTCMRLPFGYSMDHFYYYQRFRWEVPCSDKKVMTFPSQPLLKPWYWYSWPLMDLTQQWYGYYTLVYPDSQIWRLVFLPPLFGLLFMASLKVLKRWPSTPTIRKTLLWISSLAWPLTFIAAAKLVPLVIQPPIGWALFFIYGILQVTWLGHAIPSLYSPAQPSTQWLSASLLWCESPRCYGPFAGKGGSSLFCMGVLAIPWIWVFTLVAVLSLPHWVFAGIGPVKWIVCTCGICLWVLVVPVIVYYLIATTFLLPRRTLSSTNNHR